MNTYKHTQRGKLIIVAMAAGAAAMAIGALTMRPLIVGVPILLFAGWLFHSLTIEIDDDELRWSFGPGWIRKSVPLTEVSSATPVRTNTLEGWGIHYSRFGWLYNVSGFDAVAIQLKNGRKFALGTDEPGELAARLKVE